jgi:hypothetical protein
MGWRADVNTGAAVFPPRPGPLVKIPPPLRNFIRAACTLRDFVDRLRIFEIAAVGTDSQNVSDPAGRARCRTVITITLETQT